MSFTSKYTGEQIEQKLDAIESNEKVTAAALNDLNDRVKKLPTNDVVTAEISEAVITANGYTDTAVATVNSTIAELRNGVISNEKVTAAALNDVNARITSLADSIVSTINSDF